MTTSPGADESRSNTSLEGAEAPRAMIHKKIREVAEANPEASVEAIAAEVSGASVTFVERVLDEYGDPAGETDRPNRATAAATTPQAESGATGNASGQSDPHQPDPEPEPSDSEGADSGQPVELSELDEKQRETLSAVSERPTATQAEIADSLGVSRATVSKRLSAIPGFDWQSRRSFVDRLYGVKAGSSGSKTPDGPGPSVESKLEDLSESVAGLESRVQERPTESAATISDPKLVRKVTHACLDAEYISRDEELQVLRSFL